MNIDNEINTIQCNLGVDAVLLRDVWVALELKDKYSDWSKRYLAKFEQDQDWILLRVEPKRVSTGAAGGSNRVDHAVSLDMAKHLALLSETVKGREYRQALIDLEKQTIAWVITRERAKISYPDMSTALKQQRLVLGKDTSNFHYSNEAKMINKILGLPPKVDREILNEEVLSTLDRATKMNSLMIESKSSYQERKETLTLIFKAPYVKSK